MSAIPCEFCSAHTPLARFEVTGSTNPEHFVKVCEICKKQLETPETLDPNHWRCLQESMWSENPAVKVIAYRVATLLAKEGWAQDVLSQLDLDDELLEWAKAGNQTSDEGPATKDSNGTTLKTGDSVTLIKDLEVKGAGFTAKRGTLVKNITLTDDPKLIEGKVNGTQIVLKTEFLKKVT